MENKLEDDAKQCLLLVEGDDDSKFLQVFLEKLKLNTIKIEKCNGKDNLNNIIKTLSKRSDFHKFKAIGITRDADGDIAENIFKTVQNYLRSANFTIPKIMAEFSSGNPKLGVYIFPNCVDSGELENLCLDVLNDNSIECVKKFIECAEKKNGKIKKKAKSHLYAWLSIQDRCNLRLGEAAAKGLFNFESEKFHKLKEFVTELSR